MKKFILGFIFAVMAPVTLAYAAMPMLTVSGTDDNNNVTVRVTGGEINSPVVLFYNQNLSGQGTVQQNTVGTTDVNGNWTGTISTSVLGISQASPVYVQVGGYQSLPVNWPFGSSGSATSSSIITFSPASPTFSIGQNGTVTISGGGSGSYYIASNSNPNFTTASISGNTLTFNGAQQGQTSVTVCSTSGPCAVITPNFNTTGISTSTGSLTGTTSGSPTVSQGTVNVNQGGQGVITLSGGTTPYTVSVLGGNNVSTTLIGNTLYINGGTTAGMTVLNVCSAATSTTTSVSACTPVTVNVGQGQGTSAATTSSAGSPVSFTLPLTYGESLRLSLSGGNGTYYVQTSGVTPVLASISGNTLTLAGSATGSTIVNVCSTSTSVNTTTTCLPISVVVNQSTIPTGTGGGFLFDTNLSTGMSGQDVMELQQRLKDEGYFNVTPTGYFGSITAAAVRAYQIAHGLPAVGIVGPQTRALLNQ